MKRTLLFTASLCLSATLMAQNNTAVQADPSVRNIAVPNTKTILTGREAATHQNRASGGGTNNVASTNGTVIGTTTYDLQTNSSVQNRYVDHGDGTRSAVFTFSNTYDLAAPDRGTGHVYFDGTGWGPQPTSRIEQQRGGWPSILSVNGGEVNTLHNTASSVITMSSRTPKGTGSWSFSDVTNPVLDLIWNRTANGGPGGEIIHMIGVTAPEANDGTPFQGLDGALVYFRSSDGGNTWDIQNQVLPGVDATQFVGFDGDSYAITANGSTVAFAVFNQWGDVILMKSTDNGDNWTKSIINDSELDLYDPGAANSISDYTGDNVADTLETSDQSGSIILDNNGMAHVWYGLMRVLDDDPALDAGSSYFPATNGIVYWNESFGEDNGQIIAGAPDLDGDGGVGVLNGDISSIALYFVSLAGFPNASIDPFTGHIYVTFSAHMETLNNGAQHYRHVFAMKSTDNGCTWSEPFDVTPNDNFAECVFASQTPEVLDSVRFIYQEDVEPGLAVRGDEDAFDLNEIVHVGLDKNHPDFNTTGTCVTFLTGDSTFCAGDSVWLEASCGSGYSWSNGASTQGIWASTFGTFSVDITTPCGVVTESKTLSAPSVAPTLDITPSQPTMCDGVGDETTLAASAVSGGAYIWSTGATTQSIDVTSTGTYSVTVTNCGGTSSETFTLSAPTSSPVASISGDATICTAGDSAILTAAMVPSGDYTWNTGDTTQSITVLASGTYSVTVTNCLGTDNTSFDVQQEPAPTGSVNVNGELQFCENAGSVTLVATDGSSWLWSNGSTDNSITLSTAAESGLYSVTSFNVCNDQATSQDYSVNIFPQPAAPTITSNNGTYTSSIATGNQWYVNGVPVNGETNQTFTPNPQDVFGNNIYVTVTSADGCESDPSNAITSVTDLVLGVENIDVFPNPNNGAFTVTMNGVDADEYTFTTRNVVGQVVDQNIYTISGEFTRAFDLTNLESGFYFLTISKGQAESTYKIVVQ